MDKLSIISGALFLAADLFAIASLAMPNWIVSDVGGKSLKKTRETSFPFKLILVKNQYLVLSTYIEEIQTLGRALSFGMTK